MSQMGTSEDRFFLYCNADGTCNVKRGGDEAPSQQCAGLVEAVTLAQDLKNGSSIHITVYDSAGKILFQSFA
jgi:hypothetical protein